MTATLRLFFAIELNEDIRQDLAQFIEILGKEFSPQIVRWVPLKNLHITTRFIGSCEPHRISPLIEAVKKNIQHFKPFTLQLDMLHLFPSPAHAQILSVMIHSSQELLQLVKAVEQGVVTADFPGDTRSYLPHISLARFIHPPSLNLINLTSFQSKLKVDHICLFNSKQQDENRIYEVINKIVMG